MKIYGAKKETENTGHLSDVDVSKLRWTSERSDIASDVSTFFAEVADDQVDWIRSRGAREDGGWSQEICLFPGAKVGVVALDG